MKRRRLGRRGLVAFVTAGPLTIALLSSGCFLAQRGPDRPAATAVAGTAIYRERCDVCHPAEAGSTPSGATSLTRPRRRSMPDPAPRLLIHRARPDIDVAALAGEAVAVLGYGNLGRTAALNLRDSGLKVRVGNRDDSYAALARAENFEVVPLRTAAADDVVFVLLPDEVIPEVFASEIAPVLHAGGAVAFGSGYCLAFDLVRPPERVDVLLVAPRMAGTSARERYLVGEGFWACIGVEADRSGRARPRLLGLAGALGALRGGALETSAATEATLDLFVEQTLGPLIGAAIMAAFDVGRQAAIPVEALVMEMYMSGEMESVFKGFRKTGFFRASEDHGPTALFGGITRTLALDQEDLTSRFRTILEDITSGSFARRFQQEAQAGYPMLGVARELIRSGSAISEAEARLRRVAGLPAPPGTQP
jgi:ketol-acid reductoisomerase